VPVATGAASSGFSVGDRLKAELVFYPSALPLRAQIAQSLGGAVSSDDPIELPALDLSEAYRSYEQAMIAEPWLDVWPLCIRNARLRRHGSQIFLCNGADTVSPLALPLAPAQSSLAAPLLGLTGLDSIGLWDGHFLNLCWAQTSLGRWVNE